MKLIFLLRHETVLQDLPSFYDFLPYRLGPFSFTLERELEALRDHEYVMILGERVARCDSNVDRSRGEVDLLPAATSAAVVPFFRRCRARGQTELASELFRRHPWYVPSSRHTESQSSSASLQRPKKASPAGYTAGYEGTSVDAFFNCLLRRRIGSLVGVRANPVSRKYGFSKVRLSQLCKRLGFEYRHVPSLGSSSAARTGLTDFASSNGFFVAMNRRRFCNEAPKWKSWAGRCPGRPPFWYASKKTFDVVTGAGWPRRWRIPPVWKWFTSDGRPSNVSGTRASPETHRVIVEKPSNRLELPEYRNPGARERRAGWHDPEILEFSDSP